MSLAIFVDSFAMGFTQTFPQGSGSATLAVNGVQDSSWHTDGAGGLYLTDIAAVPEFNYRMTITTDAGSFTTTDPPPGFSPLLPGDRLFYQCTAEVLLIDPYSAVGAASYLVVYHKAD